MNDQPSTDDTDAVQAGWPRDDGVLNSTARYGISFALRALLVLGARSAFIIWLTVAFVPLAGAQPQPRNILLLTYLKMTVSGSFRPR